MEMTEAERARRLATEQFKKLNDKLSHERRDSARVGEHVEAGLTVSKYNEQLEQLVRMLDLVSDYEKRTGDTE
jgi:hypothetical protein